MAVAVVPGLLVGVASSTISPLRGGLAPVFVVTVGLDASWFGTNSRSILLSSASRDHLERTSAARCASSKTSIYLLFVRSAEPGRVSTLRSR